ncbi:MAG: hypothetical protein HUJ65_05405, partial [Oscillospiraceae bacterium]|nr:hypothetical protein [Oscillospiraceae bacterium]
MKKRILLFLITCLAIVLIVSTLSLSAGAVGYGAAGAYDYVYLFDVTVDNACNSKEMDKDAVNELWFSFTYVDKNGYGTEKTDKFDMSWSDGKNNNAEFLSKYFFRDSDDGYNTSFELSLPGKMTKMNILLNMDGGERLAFTINGIYCNGIRINNNTDYVSSAYYDSKAEITCSMGGSVIDVENSEYFESGTSLELTQKELNSIMNNPGKKSEFEGKIRDQFNAVIDMSVLDRCVSSPDSEINQLLSHRDEESYYKYTFWVNVENPIDLTNADYDEVEKFVIDMYYVDANGCGKSGKYTLDMSYDSGLKRNKNPEILANFQRDGDTGYQTHFDIWLPGI